MNEEIKEIIEHIKTYPEKMYCLSEKEKVIMLDYITNLQQENETLKEQNNDLRKIYRNTYKRLFENGNDELARYFQAQIDDCPTFYAEPIIDYAKEYKIYKSRCEKTIELLKLPIVYETHQENGERDELLKKIRQAENILNGSDEK